MVGAVVSAALILKGGLRNRKRNDVDRKSLVLGIVNMITIFGFVYKTKSIEQQKGQGSRSTVWNPSFFNL